MLCFFRQFTFENSHFPLQFSSRTLFCFLRCSEGCHLTPNLLNCLLDTVCQGVNSRCPCEWLLWNPGFHGGHFCLWLTFREDILLPAALLPARSIGIVVLPFVLHDLINMGRKGEGHGQGNDKKRVSECYGRHGHGSSRGEFISRNLPGAKGGQDPGSRQHHRHGPCRQLC